MNEALQHWRDEFAHEPNTAFDRLVRGIVPLGGASQLSLGEILDALFEPCDAALDGAAASWLQKHILGPVPENTSLHRWAFILEEYFRGIAAMELHKTAEILRRQHQRIRLWLHGFYEGLDRDPEGTYLIALARLQDSQRFSSLWRRIILGEEFSGRSYLAIGILGFRKMPMQNGHESSGVPDGLLQALMELADKSGTGQAKWKQTMQSMFATYRRSETFWIRKFAEISVTSQNVGDNFADWIRQLLPNWPENVNDVVAMAGNATALPGYSEMKDWQARIEDNPDQSQSDEFAAYLNRYRSHALATGQTHYLVRTFNNIAVTIVRRRPRLAPFALELMKEAMRNEPSNPRNWTSYAKVLQQNKRTEEALHVLWEARQRFPWHAFAHTDLGRLLYRTGDKMTAEAVLREARTLFPTEQVCQTTLLEFFPNADSGKLVSNVSRQIREMNCAERLGRAMIALWQAERTQAAESRDSLCKHAASLLDMPEEQIDDDLLSAFVETRGLLLLASGDARRALAYFEEQIHHYGRGGWIGIQLGDQRARIVLGSPKGANETIEPPSSHSARFALNVARAIESLSQEQQEAEVQKLLKTLYPKAAELAANVRRNDKGELELESGAEMLGTFMQSRWFRPAGIQSVEDFDQPDRLHAVVECANASRRDTLDVLQSAASGFALAM